MSDEYFRSVLFKTKVEVAPRIEQPKNISYLHHPLGFLIAYATYAYFRDQALRDETCLLHTVFVPTFHTRCIRLWHLSHHYQHLSPYLVLQTKNSSGVCLRSLHESINAAVGWISYRWTLW